MELRNSIAFLLTPVKGVIVAFKRVRTLPEWQDYFSDGSFQVLRAQGICLVEEPGREEKIKLVFVTDAKREGRWLLPRRDRKKKRKT